MAGDGDSAPWTIVEGQADAYNDGDVDAFVSYYAESAKITRLDEAEVIAAGRDEIHDEYSQLFEDVPDLRAEVLDEFSVGEFVATKERVSGLDGTREALAVYLVQDGLIQHLWIGDP